MSPLKNLKSDITQKQWIKACKKLGLTVMVSRGHGSHVRVYLADGKASTPITIQKHTYKQVNISIYKALLDLGFSEQEIDKALK